MRKLQQKRFKEQLDDVLGLEYTESYRFNDRDEIVNAKFNTKEHLNKIKLKKLEFIAETWGFQDYSVKRSGTGLTFEFMDFKGVPELV